MSQWNFEKWITIAQQIQEKSNWKLISKTYYFILCIVKESVKDNDKELSFIKVNYLNANPYYHFDYWMSNEDIN